MAFVLKREAATLERNLELRGGIGEQHGVVDVVFRCEIVVEAFGYHPRSGFTRPEVQEHVDCWIGCRILPVLVAIDLSPSRRAQRSRDWRQIPVLDRAREPVVNDFSASLGATLIEFINCMWLWGKSIWSRIPSAISSRGVRSRSTMSTSILALAPLRAVCSMAITNCHHSTASYSN